MDHTNCLQVTIKTQSFHSYDGGLLPSLFRGALGNEGVSVSDSGRRQWFFFWETKFMYFCSVLCLIIYKQSL